MVNRDDRGTAAAMALSGSGFSSPLVFVGFITLFAVAGLLVLWYDDPAHSVWRTAVRRWAHRLTGRGDLAWVDAPLLTGIAAYGMALVTMSIATAAWPLELETHRKEADAESGMTGGTHGVLQGAGRSARGG